MDGWRTDAEDPVGAVVSDGGPDCAGVDGPDGWLVVRFCHDPIGEKVRDGLEVFGAEGLRGVFQLLMCPPSRLVDRGRDDGEADVAGSEGNCWQSMQRCTSTGKSWVSLWRSAGLVIRWQPVITLMAAF